jgi:hypothetical protein
MLSDVDKKAEGGDKTGDAWIVCKERHNGQGGWLMCMHGNQVYLMCPRCGAWENRCLDCGMVLQDCVCRRGGCE